MAFRFGEKTSITLRSEIRIFINNTKNLKSLYRGFAPTACGMAVYSGTSFFLYDTLIHHVQSHSGTNSIQVDFLKFLSGFVAGLSAQALSYPLDVLRRRMQVYHIAPHLQKQEYSITAMIRSIYNQEGVYAFWRGFSINFLKVAPATAISFYSYNVMKSLI
jgi:hypothetical protein